ncbi:MAG: response regulator [Ruminococcus sp.]|nr:response regulator [Ruminococcus sp.]
MEKLKIVLIDDERIVLNGIKAILKKEKDVDLAGVADNGLDGLKTVLTQRPDIVLTDIRMPGLSGLELIRKAKETLPDTVYIIFSGYNEFQYVKEALGLGVIDYLEKPITIEKLREVLDKAVQIYNYRQNYARMTRNMKKAEKTYVERSLREVYEQPWDEERNLKKVLEQNPELEYADSVCVMKAACRKTQSIDEYRCIIQQLVFELVQEYHIEIYSFSEYESLVLAYFSFEKEPFPFRAEAERGMQRLEEEGIECYVGISRIHENFYGIRNAFVEAEDAIRYARYLESADVVSFDEVEYATSIPRDLNKNQNSISFNFRTGQLGLCREQVKEYLDHLKQMDLMPELFKQKCMELLFSLKNLLDEMDKTRPHDLDLGFTPDLRRFSADEMTAWVMEKTDFILESAAAQETDGKNKAIRTAKNYIEQHFQEGVTLDMVAEQIHMSPTYLSMLFKQEEGITYIRYLTRVRMEKAMEYIRQGYKAKQVCEMVGYYDYKHFSTQFKNYAGMTLDAYKKKTMGTP